MSRASRGVSTRPGGLACPDCNATVSTARRGRVLDVTISHDATCPWHQRVSGGKPFTVTAILDRARRSPR